MRFGLTLVPDNLSNLARRANLADELGYHLVGVGDSQSLLREAYVSLAVVAYNTSKALLGPTATNPYSRHPVVTASAIASVDELSGGRAFLGIASGDTALSTIGVKPASLASLRDTVLLMRDLFGGKPVARGDSTYWLKWAARPVPVYLAAGGPKTLRLAGQIADGVLIGTGLLPEVVKGSLELVKQGAEEAGRDWRQLDLWFCSRANVAESREQAVGEIKSALAGVAHHAFRFTLEGKWVPKELAGPIERLTREYITGHHVSMGASRNATLSDELGLTEYLADRFAIVGTPEDCRRKVRSIKEAGVENVILTALCPDPDRLIRLFGQEVLPLFS